MRQFTLFLCACLLTVGSVLAQNRVINGVITLASDGSEAIGVSVVVKGQTSIGTTTDLDGKFRLSVPASATTLVISYVGMQTVEVPIKDNIKIALREDAQVLDGVVVTGMLKVDKRLFTGASTKVGGDKSKMDGMADAARALEGKAAGVSVQNVSGSFGSAPKIRVRGATSIYGASKPLWVVDGVVMEDVVDVDADALASGDATTLISSAIAGINPDDIESFQVLKDGSATSIYGARAMAGVIVVTTKKGHAGVSRISYTGEYTYRIKPSYRQFNIMNSQEQMSVYREMEQKGWLLNADVSNAASSGVYGKLWEGVNNGTILNTPEGRSEFLRRSEYLNTDWFDLLFNDNILSTHSVSVTSGTDKASIYASLSAMVDPGWTKQSKVNRYTANLNMTYRLTDNLSLNLLSNAAFRKQRAPGTLNQNVNVLSGQVNRDFDINPYSYALNTSRVLDPNEVYVRSYAPFNIFTELDNNFLDISVVDMKFQTELKWTPIRGLELTALGDVKYSGSETEHTITEMSNQAQSMRAAYTTTIRDRNPQLYKDPDQLYGKPITVLPQGGFLNTTDYSILSWDFRGAATYNTQLGESLLNLYGGMEINSYDRYTKYYDGVGIQFDMGGEPYSNYLYFKRAQEEGTKYFGISQAYYRNVAFFGNATYSYQGKYTINGTLRYEGTNKMGKSISARWLPTWNISGAWNVDQEKFFRSLQPTLSSLTLKASYSLTADKGPASVSNSSIIITSNTPWRAVATQQETGFEIYRSENSTLTYEKKHELNLGFDAGFLDGRINTSFDWYMRNNFDLIGPVNTMGMSGAVLQWGNVASMKSSGVELSISTTNIKNKDFSWSTDFVFGHSTNEITELQNRARMIDLISGSGFGRQGYPVRALFSVPFAGLNSQGLPTFYTEDGSTTVTGINFQQRDGLDFLKYEGPADPTLFGSLGNTFTYKGFKFNAFLTYSFGNVVRLDPVFNSSYNDLAAMPREFENRWISPGDESRTDIPVLAPRRLVYETNNIGYAYNAYNYSDARIAKGDFIRLKEVSLSYDFPTEWAKALYMNSLSVKLQATNLLLLYSDSKLNGQDPEFLNAGGVATPLPRQITMTLRLGI